MDPGIDHLLFDGHLGAFEYAVGGCLVTRFPGEDMVVMGTLALAGLVLAHQVLADHRGIRCHGLVWIDNGRQLFILHLDEFHGIRGDIAIIRNHHGHFLILEYDLFIREYRLDITRQGWHPVQIQRLEILSREDRVYTGQFQCPVLVDRFDTGMGPGAADDIAEQHTR